MDSGYARRRRQVFSGKRRPELLKQLRIQLLVPIGGSAKTRNHTSDSWIQRHRTIVSHRRNPFPSGLRSSGTPDHPTSYIRQVWLTKAMRRIRSTAVAVYDLTITHT